MPFNAGAENGIVSLADFNVRDDGTDQTEAIQQAIDSTPVGGSLIIPPTSEGFTTGPLIIDKPMRMAGTTRTGSRLNPTPDATGYLFTLQRNADSSLWEESHGYGVELANLHLDGGQRGPAVGAIKADLIDRLCIDYVQVRGFRHEALNLYRSCREGEIRGLYARGCGDATHPTLNLSDRHVGDQHNNLTFDGCRFLYGFGDLVWIKPVVSTTAVRAVFFNGCMFHNMIPANVGTEYPEEGTELSGRLFDVADARNIVVSNSRLHASGYGQPLALIRKGANGASSVNSLIVNASVLGAVHAATINATADDSSDTFTSADHNLGTGALVRTSGGGLSDATDHWVIRVDADTFQLTSSLADAEAGTPIPLTTSGPATVIAQQRHLDLHHGYVVVSGGSHFEFSANRAHVINRTGDPARVVTDGVLVSTATTTVESTR